MTWGSGWEARRALTHPKKDHPAQQPDPQPTTHYPPPPHCSGQVDQFLLEAMEGIACSFFSLVTRTCSIWEGGCYALILALDEDAVAARIVARSERLWVRLLAFEEAMANGTTDEGMHIFEDGLLWPCGILYRDLLGLLGAGRLLEAKICIRRMHCSKYHEEGAL